MFYLPNTKTCTICSNINGFLKFKLSSGNVVQVTIIISKNITHNCEICFQLFFSKVMNIPCASQSLAYPFQNRKWGPRKKRSVCCTTLSQTQIRSFLRVRPYHVQWPINPLKKKSRNVLFLFKHVFGHINNLFWFSIWGGGENTNNSHMFEILMI